ncbi:NADH:flavin oxidoreductase [Undibacterium pigrum]|uniref:2,4-dienoyl-CoA reductase-like NADH-dependent reductase (Old Yellow Enzyme family) n=1 Tax=Undibacterium pigrum TaxID=401470 RepID=A0A318J4G3_9BURK|nr:NADH:flavin oxidoreductase [Undibacterium pigrum]PXX41581.1 2,4-dienoyl-CoA reductase-like NADH-dependent reductase (Old Yellow Enzyme family) [Undibacterium pigrum]
MNATTTPDTHLHDCLFQPVSIGRMTLKNRLAVAPMTRISASDGGCATEQMARYYTAFAKGGFGLIISEGIYTDRAYSQGYLNQPGLSDDHQRDAWTKVVDAVHQDGGRMIAQLMHAGALSQGNPYRSDTLGPSAVRPQGQQMSFYRGKGEYPIPHAMADDAITEAINGFAAAAVRAKQAGFDGVEIHGANGYLLDQFLSEGINLRNDRYGGDIACRLRLIIEVVQAVRTAVGPEFTLGMRISQGKVNDFTHKWRNAETDAALIFSTLAKLPIDYIHTTEFEAWQSAFGNGPSLAALARQYADLPVIANGSLHDPTRAANLIASGQANAISLGRGALTHADWPARVLRGLPLNNFDPGISSPIADLNNEEHHRLEHVHA